MASSASAADVLVCVPPRNAAVLWNVVRPMLEAAYANVDEFMPADLLAELNDGKLLLWVSAPAGEVIAALITALVPRPSGLSCKLMVCGGSGIEHWASGHRQIESYAREEGCATMCAEGRLGWARALPGYAMRRVVLEKRLI